MEVAMFVMILLITNRTFSLANIQGHFNTFGPWKPYPYYLPFYARLLPPSWNWSQRHLQNKNSVCALYEAPHIFFNALTLAVFLRSSNQRFAVSLQDTVYISRPLSPGRLYLKQLAKYCSFFIAGQWICQTYLALVASKFLQHLT